MENFIFGCEFEFSTNYEEAIDYINNLCKNNYLDENLFSKKRGWFKSKRNRRWDIKTDSSTECEICTPRYSLNDIEHVCNIISFFKDLKVTNKDSFHIHFSPNKEKDKLNIIFSWLYIEQTIFKCFPRHRKNSQYCERYLKGTKKGKFSNYFFENAYLLDFDPFDHYSAFSLYYLKNRKSLELRISEGTKDITHIRNWIIFSYYFWNFSKTINRKELINEKNIPHDANWLIKIMKIDDKELKKWLRKRYKQFNS